MTWILKSMSIGLIVLLISSCSAWWDVSDTYDPDFPVVAPLGAQSPMDIGRWLTDNIRYFDDDIHDISEYWQSPDQTYVWRTGDCEDYAILMMYIIHKELGGWPLMVIGRGNDVAHAWVRYEGRDYEAQGGDDITERQYYISEYPHRETIQYGIALWRSMNIHRLIGEGERRK